MTFFKSRNIHWFDFNHYNIKFNIPALRQKTLYIYTVKYKKNRNCIWNQASSMTVFTIVHQNIFDYWISFLKIFYNSAKMIMLSWFNTQTLLASTHCTMLSTL